MQSFPPLIHSPGSKLYSALKSGKIKLVNPCGFSPDTFSHQKWLSESEKSSSSSTVIMFSDLVFRLNPNFDETRGLNPQVVLKIAPYPENEEHDNSILAEQQMYEKIVSKALMSGFTPHLMAYIGSFNCSFREAVKFAPRLADLKHHFDNPRNGRLTVTILEQGKGKTLQNLSMKLNESHWLSVIFQTLWTVEVIGALKGRHNDLHLGNVFIDTKGNYGGFNYFFSSKQYFRIPIYPGLFVKVFDWDFGTADNVRNTKVIGEMCTSYATCEGKNPKYDSFIFMWNLLNHSSFPKTLVKKIEDCCLDKKLVDQFNRNSNVLNGRLCHKTRTGCDGQWIPPDSKLLPPLKFLMSLFSDHIYSLNDIEQDLEKAGKTWDEWFHFTYFHPNFRNTYGPKRNRMGPIIKPFY